MANPARSVNLYPETIGLAVWVVVYTLISAVLALFTHILFRLNNQRAAYVSLTCIAIFLQQLVTIAQEIIAAIRWAEIQILWYHDNVANWRNPDASIVYKASPEFSLQLTLAIEPIFFNVESLLFFFWSFLLCSSLWEIQWGWIRNSKFILISKYASFVLPAIQAGVVHFPGIYSEETLHLVINNCIMVTTITFGILFLLLILMKLIMVSISSKNKSVHVQDDRKKNVTEDKWLIVRFIVGFCIIGALQTSFLYSQYEYAMTVKALRAPTAKYPTLGWTKTQQLSDWAYYMAGSSTGLLIVLVFGTTRESRAQAHSLFRRFRGNIGYHTDGFNRSWKSLTKNNSDSGFRNEKYDHQFNCQPVGGTPQNPYIAYDISLSLSTEPGRAAVQRPFVPLPSPTLFRPSAYRNIGTAYEDEYRSRPSSVLQPPMSATLPPMPLNSPTRLVRPRSQRFPVRSQPGTPSYSSRAPRTPRTPRAPHYAPKTPTYPPIAAQIIDENLYDRNHGPNGFQSPKGGPRNRNPERNRSVVISLYDYRPVARLASRKRMQEPVSPVTPDYFGTFPPLPNQSTNF